MRKPEVTIFMAVYNGAKYIREAINSALNQTFKDFELLVIDDGSEDESMQIVSEYSDSRIRVLHNETNLGLFKTRNRGINEAKGRYFATLDCDDIASLDRLQIQLKYFENHPDYMMCGGKVKYIDHRSNIVGKGFPVHDDFDYLRSLMLFTNVFSNSTTMISTAVLRAFMYREGFEPAEDYDLFERIATQYKIGFINEFLSHYRLHENNTSTIKHLNKQSAEKKIIKRQLDRYEFDYDNEEFNLHLNFTTGKFEFEKYSPKDFSKWLRGLAKKNKSKGAFNPGSFNLALTRQWIRVCIRKLKEDRDISPFLMRPMNYRSFFKLIGQLL